MVLRFVPPPSHAQPQRNRVQALADYPVPIEAPCDRGPPHTGPNPERSDRMNTPSSDRTHFLPSHVHGTADERYAGVARAFGRLFAGRGGGGALCVYHHGTKVIDIWTGTSDHLGVRPWTADTAAIAMSVTKCVAATVIHRLSDRGLIDYDAPVAEYWPEFGAQGKSDITVREVLSHRAGLSPFSTIASTIDELLDHHLSEQRIAASAPTFLRGMPAYHGLTYGVLLAGLARAVTGHGMAELFQTEVAQPLGIDDFHLGRPPGGRRLSQQHFMDQLHHSGARLRFLRGAVEYLAHRNT